MSMKHKLNILRWTIYAFVRNAHAEWSNRRLENKRRQWQALKTGGGGVVPLGRCNMEQARRKTAEFGTIDYVDVEVACVMFSSKFK